MLRRMLPIAVFLLCSLSSRGQVGLLPKVSVFGGYSYANADFTGVDRFSMNGWEASASLRGNPFLGFKADFSGHYGTQNVLGTNVNSHVYTYLFGPQISAPLPKITPFAHALFGAAQIKASALGGSATDTSFGMALGGGLDYHFAPFLAWRVQGDYLQTRFFNDKQNNARFSTGLVLNF
jgi:opacity protein-like surface antigen